MVGLFHQGNYAMGIGSYTLVDSSLNGIPPGLVAHREWSDENGHNNALRINGLGAPRAFNTDLMRQIGFLNVSYGEDYAAALQSVGNIGSGGFTKASTSVDAGRVTLMRFSTLKRQTETMPSRTRSGLMKFSPVRK